MTPAPIPPPSENPPINEQLWQTWLARGRQAQAASARNFNWLVILAALGAAMLLVSHLIS